MLSQFVDCYLIKDKVEKYILERDVGWGFKSEKNEKVIIKKCRREEII